MKLYRSHSREFQKEIEKGQFVTDFSRKFNTADPRGKNWGRLFFYAPTISGALSYAQEGMLPVWEYRASGLKLLDLRIKENRALLPAVIAEFIRKDEKKRQCMIKHVPAQYLQERSLHPTTVEDVINDNVLDGHTYWGQRATDYQFGEIMRSELERLGFDGIIFEEGRSIDIALLSPAEFIGEVKIKEVA